MEYDPKNQTWSDKVYVDVDPRSACFPMLHQELHVKQKQVELGILGTGFFISNIGLFLTAKHVVKRYENKPTSPLKAVLLHEGKSKITNVNAIYHYDASDVSIGMVDLRSDGWVPPVFRLTTSRLSPGDKIASFGYSNTQQVPQKDHLKVNLSPDFYDGEVIDYHESGFTIAKWPVYQHTMNNQAGISGGPVFKIEDGRTRVSGITCTGLSTGDGGVFSAISAIVDEPIVFIKDHFDTLKTLSQHRPDILTPFE